MLRATRGRFQRVVAGFFLGLGLVPVGEASEGMKEGKEAFFTLERRALVGERETFPSLFGEAFRPGKVAVESISSSFISPDLFPVSGELVVALSPGSPAVEAGAFAPTGFRTGQKIEVPAGFCRTRQCKTFVIVGAAVAGGGAALMATGGEANRKLGAALALAGCGLVIVVLLID